MSTQEETAATATKVAVEMSDSMTPSEADERPSTAAMTVIITKSRSSLMMMGRNARRAAPRTIPSAIISISSNVVSSRYLRR